MDPERALRLAPDRRFPRRRGDGPSPAHHGAAGRAFPPQARGWTMDSVAVVRATPVSPAGAGMDPTGGGGRLRGNCFPRRRGDGPRSAPTASCSLRFPPQARGWTVGRGGGRGEGGVSPAGAGMDLRPGRRPLGPGGFPRRRGDGPDTSRATDRPRRFPPQARGWTARIRAVHAAGQVSPAGAGMDPAPPRPRGWPSGFPRRRGDGPYCRECLDDLYQFPPQARGWTSVKSSAARQRRVSPAGAGMDLPCRTA